MKHSWKNTRGNRTLITAAAITAVFALTAFSSSGHRPLSSPETAMEGTITDGGSVNVQAAVAAPQVGIERKEAPVTHAPAVSEYDNKAVANVTDVLNLRAEPSLDGKILGKCYRGAGGTVLEKKDGWTKIRSGSLEGWLKNDYLIYGQDIKPLAKELGLFTARVATQTLHVRETPSTDAAIIGLAAADDYYPVLEESDGWIKVQLSSDTAGYISSQYAKVSLTPGKAVSIEAEQAALKAAENKEQKKKEEEKPTYVIHASSDEIYLMAACVMMESGSYSYDGQLAVASVIVNRVKSGRWGSTITDVIYADGQFPGATSGLLDKFLAKGPSSEALKATKAALTGSNNIGDYLFFNSAKRADFNNYSSYTVVGGNCFYKK